MIRSIVVAIASLLFGLPVFAQERATLQMLFVIDGLRPDSITAGQTPNLHRLRTEGVTFDNSHSVFPTVTRVNSASSFEIGFAIATNARTSDPPSRRLRESATTSSSAG